MGNFSPLIIMCWFTFSNLHGSTLHVCENFYHWKTDLWYPVFQSTLHFQICPLITRNLNLLWKLSGFQFEWAFCLGVRWTQSLSWPYIVVSKYITRKKILDTKKLSSYCTRRLDQGRWFGGRLRDQQTRLKPYNALHTGLYSKKNKH